MPKMFLDDELLDSDGLDMPLLSRGFAFGFGVFETMKFLERKPCFFHEHLTRLERAVGAAGLKLELDEFELRDRAGRLFEAEDVRSGVFKIVITDRGEDTKVAMFVRNRELPAEPSPVTLVSSEVRKASQAFTSRHKSLNYMESLLELEKAKAAGFSECVFRNEHGHLTECAIANLFWLKAGVLQTPDVNCGLLDGIVRGKVIALAIESGMEVEEGAFGEEALLEADEVFMTSSGNGPRPARAFTSSSGAVKEYSIEKLPELRAAYLELERREALRADV